MPNSIHFLRSCSLFFSVLFSLFLFLLLFLCRSFFSGDTTQAVTATVRASPAVYLDRLSIHLPAYSYLSHRVLHFTCCIVSLASTCADQPYQHPGPPDHRPRQSLLASALHPPSDRLRGCRCAVVTLCQPSRVGGLDQQQQSRHLQSEPESHF